ncbi:MAG TPA: hypothetical protein VMZ22_02115 [Acidimicrobiales bacterium]|nr:hypothetical protein [Acidimicrobiales bacterium]
MRRAALVALGVWLLAALTPGAATAKEAKGLPLQAMRAVLTARAEAQQAKDRDAYARTIDPSAPAAFRDAQMRSFDNFVALPVDKIEYSIDADEPDLTRGVVRTAYPGAEQVALATTTRSLRFAYDSRTSLDAMFWTFVKRNGAWFVGGDDDVADLGLETTVSMWDTAPVVVEQSTHFQMIVHAAHRARALELVGLAEQALAKLNAGWTLPWSGKLVGFLPMSTAELADLIQASVDVTKFVAFVGYGYEPDSLRTTVPRLYVQDANLGLYAPAGQVETLLHELTHAAGSDYAGSYIPTWLHEGLADWVSGGTSKRYPRASGAGTTAPRDDEFGAGTQGEIVRAYRDAASLIAALSRIAGPQAPFSFFQTLGAYTVRAGNTPYAVDEALRTLGIADLATLERDWVAGR